MKRKLNKSEAIRQAFGELGNDATNSEVMALLSKKKIDVASALVSNVRTAMDKPKGKRGRKVQSESNGNALQLAKAFAKEHGIDLAANAVQTVLALQIGSKADIGGTPLVDVVAIIAAKGFVESVGAADAVKSLETLADLQIS